MPPSAVCGVFFHLPSHSLVSTNCTRRLVHAQCGNKTLALTDFYFGSPPEGEVGGWGGDIVSTLDCTFVFNCHIYASCDIIMLQFADSRIHHLRSHTHTQLSVVVTVRNANTAKNKTVA